jgi:uncharacterized membrane protein (DUF4010 family)
LGAATGIGLTGILGGIVSSTATTLSFTGRSKTTPALSPTFGGAIVIASTMMFARVLVEVFVVHRPLLRSVIVPVGAMLITGWLVSAFLWQRGQSQASDTDGEIDLTNPLNLSTAVKFGLLFAAVLVLTKAADSLFGTAGVYVASIITGFTDVDSITLSVSELAATGEIEATAATVAIILAVLTNTLTKAALAASLGSRELRRTVIPAFGTMLLVGIASTGVMFWLAGRPAVGS